MYSCLAVICVTLFVVTLATTLYWNWSIMTSCISPWLLRGRWRMKACPSRRQNSTWMQNYFSMSTLGGRLGHPTTHSSSRGCSYMPQSPGRRKWSNQFAKATSKVSQGWMLGQMYLPSSSWDTRPSGRRSGGYITKSTCWEDCPAFHHVG